MKAEALHIELLHSCRLHCLACDHRQAGRARLSASDLRPVLRDRRFRELKMVSFSGGEPLLHPGLRSFILSAAESFPRATMVLLTSLAEGTRLLNLLRALPPAILARMHVGSSLDGPPPVHDTMRGSPGAFSRLERNLRAVQRSFPGISMSFTFTATSANSRRFYDTWLEARRMGVPLGIQFLVPNANTGELALSAGDRSALQRGLSRAAGQGGGTTSGLQAALAFLAGETAAPPCGAGRTFFMLSPEGQFYLCPFHKEFRAPLSGIGGLRKKLSGTATRYCSRCFLRCRG